MTMLLTSTIELTLKENGFDVRFFFKKPMELSFSNVSISIVDAMYEDFCIITFNDADGQQHVLTVTDYEEPLLDGELMFI